MSVLWQARQIELSIINYVLSEYWQWHGVSNYNAALELCSVCTSIGKSRRLTHNTHLLNIWSGLEFIHMPIHMNMYLCETSVLRERKGE